MTHRRPLILYAVLALLVAGAAALVWNMRPKPVPPRGAMGASSVAADFLRDYVSPEGRVIDDGNGGISHSEGQGYGLLFAEAANDRAAFDRILAWTRTHLGARGDGLTSWLWDPRTGTVGDENNATDGDTLIAWALLRASDRWGEQAYVDEAHTRMAAIVSKLVRQKGSDLILLPGAVGFERDGAMEINLSQWVFPAFQRMAKEGDPIWSELLVSGLSYVRKSGFGKYRLTPDWVDILDDGQIGLNPDREPLFAYNSVRIPLHLCWIDPRSLAGSPPDDLLGRYKLFWSSYLNFTDQWNVVDDISAGDPPPEGYQAVGRLTLENCDVTPVAISSGDVYYSAALKGLIALAMQDRALWLQ